MTESTTESPNGSDEDVCDEVLGYLAEHPRAMDSLQGIAEWWLPRHYIRIGVERVARALDTLTRRGLLERVDGSDPVLYRLKGSAPSLGSAGVG